MPYTLWHRGVLIGETEFESLDSDTLDTESPDIERRDMESAPPRDRRGHLVGAFQPTAYGRGLLPRLCGILTAAADLKEELVRHGSDADDASPELIEHLFENTAAGAHIIDIGRVLCDVELRAPTGVKLEVQSMGFMDLSELAQLSRRFGEEPEPLHQLPPEAPEFLVSVTLRKPMRYWIRE
jgi:hypothetical protein